MLYTLLCRHKNYIKSYLYQLTLKINNHFSLNNNITLSKIDSWVNKTVALTKSTRTTSSSMPIAKTGSQPKSRQSKSLPPLLRKSYNSSIRTSLDRRSTRMGFMQKLMNRSSHREGFIMVNGWIISFMARGSSFFRMGRIMLGRFWRV